MVSLNKSIIAKAIFGISVVAITATAGVAGFASAARHHDRDDGYGGYGGNAALIQAAVAAFNTAVGGATSKLQSDIAKCVANVGEPTTEANKFRKSSTDAASNFSAQTANPTAFSNESKFDDNVKGADSRLGRDVDSDSNNLTANVDRDDGFNSGRHNTLQKCIGTANKTFRNSIAAAERTLRNTLRSIFS